MVTGLQQEKEAIEVRIKTFEGTGGTSANDQNNQGGLWYSLIIILIAIMIL